MEFFSGTFAQREMEEDGRRRAETRKEAAAEEEGLPAEGHLFSDDQKKQLLCGLNGIFLGAAMRG